SAGGFWGRAIRESGTTLDFEFSSAFIALSRFKTAADVSPALDVPAVRQTNRNAINAHSTTMAAISAIHLRRDGCFVSS
ncbi:MAG: hypothetical protein ABI583_00980, partial [Betaproteobacteria bacterium]